MEEGLGGGLLGLAGGWTLCPCADSRALCLGLRTGWSFEEGEFGSDCVVWPELSDKHRSIFYQREAIFLIFIFFCFSQPDLA